MAKTRTSFSMRTIDPYKLSNYMFKAGYSHQYELTEKIGANSSYLSGVLISGKISLRYLFPLCDALNISPKDILVDNADDYSEEVKEDVISPEEALACEISAAIVKYVQSTK